MPVTQKSKCTKEGNAKCNRFSEISHKMVRWPEKVCGVSGGKLHPAKICANVATVFAYEADASGEAKILNGE